MRDASELVLAAFLADAYALGTHWVYDQKALAAEPPTPELDNPRSPYHPRRRAGEQSPYGDQMLWLLQQLVKQGGWNPREWVLNWQVHMRAYDAYVDGASKTTLANLAAGLGLDQAGSNSDDLSAAVRTAPLVWWFRDDKDALVHAVQDYAGATHNNPLVKEAAALLAWAAYDVLRGESPVDALYAVCGHYRHTEAGKLVLQGLTSADLETPGALASFGLSCSARQALAGVGHLVGRYSGRPLEGLMANNLAGGETCARALGAMLLWGAERGADSLPAAWTESLVHGDRVLELTASGR